MSARAAGGAADSAGVPWAGRTLTAQPFAGDNGGGQQRFDAAARQVPVMRAWRDSDHVVVTAVWSPRK